MDACLFKAEITVGRPLGGLWRSLGSAPGWGPGGHEFKSRQPDLTGCGGSWYPAWFGARRSRVRFPVSRRRGPETGRFTDWRAVSSGAENPSSLVL